MQLDDFNWFVKNYDNLYAHYGKCYLAIHNKTVLGSYDNARRAIEETKVIIPIGEFIVQLCNGEESGYTNYIASMSFAN